MSGVIHLNRQSQERIPAGDMCRIIWMATVTGSVRQIGAVLARGSRTVTPIPSGGRHSVVVGVTAILTPTRLMHRPQLCYIVASSCLINCRYEGKPFVHCNNYICLVNYKSSFAKVENIFEHLFQRIRFDPTQNIVHCRVVFIEF